MLWLVFGAVTLGAMAIALWPLLKSGNHAPRTRAEHDLAVYRTQLRELEGDAGRGLLTGAEADTARIEVERRLLAVAATATAKEKTYRDRSWITAAVVATLIPAFAVPFYLVVGSPEVPGLPFADRDNGGPLSGQQVFDLVDRLAQRMAERPDDVKGWRLLGRSYSTLGRYAEAAEAFRHAVALDSEDAATSIAFGENLMLSAGGVISAEARGIFEYALALAPDEPGARYYVALTHFQAGEFRKAYDGWLALATDSPADAPWLEDVRLRLSEAAAELGIDAPGLASATRDPGPSAGDIAEAAELTDSERGEFIRSMVERLATRLEDEPGDLDGWLRLGRAYAVLDDGSKAKQAYVRALALAPDNPDALNFLGLSEAEAGNPEVAREHWRRLLDQLDPSSPEYADLESRLAGLPDAPGD